MRRPLGGDRAGGAVSTDSVTREVAAERERQDMKWGGPIHDDQHTTTEFVQRIEDYAGWARMMASFGSRDKARLRLIQVAALAVAAVESMDRQAQRHRTLTPNGGAVTPSEAADEGIARAAAVAGITFCATAEAFIIRYASAHAGETTTGERLIAAAAEVGIVSPTIGKAWGQPIRLAKKRGALRHVMHSGTRVYVPAQTRHLAPTPLWMMVAV